MAISSQPLAPPAHAVDARPGVRDQADQAGDRGGAGPGETSGVRVNDETWALLFDVVKRVERGIAAMDCPAVVALQGRRTLVLSDYDYLRDRETAVAFERRAAVKGREVGADRWVFAVPQVWRVDAETVAARVVSIHPLRPGEQETITWMAGGGVDYGRVPYARRPGGEPVFGEPEVFTVDLNPGDPMPGFTLLRALFDDDAGDAERVDQA